jgi:hypothetical protein
MTFRMIPLADSWFSTLDLTAIRGRADRLPDPSKDRPNPWRCVVDEERRVLMTQLISTTAERRDFLYSWLLAIGDEVFLIDTDVPRASLVAAAGLPVATYERTIGLAMEAWAVLDPRCGPYYRFPPTPPSPPAPQDSEVSLQQRIEAIQALGRELEEFIAAQLARRLGTGRAQGPRSGASKGGEQSSGQRR